MKALLVGLGSAGFGWYKKLRTVPELELAVVDADPNMKTKIETDPVPFYTSLTEAIERGRPDFVVNVTPPNVHTRVNEIAFDHKLPVLCEKPISFDFAESVRIVRRAKMENIPFMIAENYRCFPYMRKLKRLLDDGAIGRISFVDVWFYRYHHVKRNYTVSLLDDIAVHHFDLFRYLTGREGRWVFAKQLNPPGSWSDDGANINLYVWIEMEGGIPVTFTGSISARGPETPWCGNWRIEGTDGCIELVDRTIKVIRSEQSTVISDFSDVPSPSCLDEFLASLRENREAETSGTEYLKTQALVHCAGLSSRSGRLVDVAAETADAL